MPKAYSMNEMKAIVTYINENKLYSEIKGRKMWVDFANTGLLSRSWQSMKETFLKRILKDIHNPYYGLTVQQICSFRQGYDVERDQPRLEIQTVSGSSGNEEDKQDKEVSDKNVINENTDTGEDILKCSKIENRNRSSTETLVLDKYETAEEIQKILESDDDTPPRKSFNGSTLKKSLKDCIVYSQPLTPMLQAVVDDFSTDDEPQMQIVENPQEIEGTPDLQEIDETQDPQENSKKPEYIKNKSPIEEIQSRDPQNVEVITDSNDNKTKNDNTETFASNKSQTAKAKSLKLKKPRKSKRKNNNETDSDAASISENNTTSDPKKKRVEENSKGNKKETNSLEICSNDTPDSILPNNQEGLESNFTIEKNSNEKVSDPKTDSENIVIEVVLPRNSEIIENTEQTNANSNNDPQPTLEKSRTVSATNETAQEINPCLKTVSLFEEQFRTYSNSETDEECNDKSGVKDISTNKNNHDINVNRGNIIDITNESDNNNAVTNNDTNINNNKSDENHVHTDVKTKDNPENMATNNHNKVVLLKSHSDTDSEVFEPPHKKVNKNVRLLKEQKTNAIANILGFKSERPSRKRTVSHRDRVHRRHSTRQRTLSRHSRHRDQSLESSDDYTTISEDDDYSPKHKSRRYVKPRSYGVMTFPGDRGLFIMDGKKIYPIIEQVHNMKYFVSMSDGETDDREASTSAAYWKAKYLEEQKRLAEERIRCEEIKRMLQAKEQKLEETLNNQDSLQKVVISSSSEEIRRKKEITSRVGVPEEDNGQNDSTVKIKMTKDHEIELECKWMQVNPILEKMAHLFRKPTAMETEAAPRERSSSDAVIISSGKSSPLVDPEVHETVNKIEGEIFKEIAELEKSASDKSARDENVTQRKRGRSKKVSTTSNTSLPDNADKSTIQPVVENDQMVEIVKENTTEPKQASPIVSKATKVGKSRRVSVRKSKPALETVDANKSKDNLEVKNTAAKRQRRSKSDTTLKRTKIPTKTSVKSPRTINVKSSPTVTMESPQTTNVKSPRTSNVKSPPTANVKSPPTANVKSPPAANVKSPRIANVRSRSSSRVEVHIPDDESVRYKFPARKRRPPKADQVDSVSYVTRDPSPESATLNSVDSSLGYQDSDPSPTIINVRRKKRFSLTNYLSKVQKQRSKIRRRSHPYLSSQDSYERHMSIKRSRNTSLDSEVYRSESYDLLMNKVRSFFKLDKIDEHTYNIETSNYLTPESMATVDSNEKQFNESTANSKTEAHSSNVSLPTSPALSIVEKISISKDSISCLEVSHPTINETLENDDVTMKSDPNKYVISEVDVSVPLMEQDCEVLERNNVITNNNEPSTPKNAISDSLINKISSVNLAAQSPSESLHGRLQKLLLESSKKEQLQVFHKSSAMEVDPEPNKETKPSKGKRSSTPHKKRAKRKTKASSVEPVIEEHTEFCRAGRRSRLPIINLITCESEIVNLFTPDFSPESTKGKARKKKDVIKVKIQKPKNKNTSIIPKKLRRPKSDSRLSNDGTNDAESGICLQVSDDSVELIHNHSETCLHVNECIDDSSLEIIERNSDDNVILVNTSASDDSRCYESNQCEKHGLPESFCCKAQVATNYTAKSHIKDIDSQSGETVYHTLNSEGSLNSLMTEDLSDGSPPSARPQPSNWHLLSEEETITCPDVNANQSGTYVFSNLSQIFPITYAVPNLSTITENTDSNSRRPTNEKNDSSSEVLSSKSIFDTIF